MSVTSGSIDSPSIPIWWATTARVVAGRGKRHGARLARPFATLAPSSHRPQGSEGGTVGLRVKMGDASVLRRITRIGHCIVTSKPVVAAARRPRRWRRSARCRGRRTLRCRRPAGTVYRSRRERGAPGPRGVRGHRSRPATHPRQFAGQAEDCGDVVGGAGCVEAVDEPHPLLGERQQDARRTRIGNGDQDHGAVTRCAGINSRTLGAPKISRTDTSTPSTSDARAASPHRRQGSCHPGRRTTLSPTPARRRARRQNTVANDSSTGFAGACYSASTDRNRVRTAPSDPSCPPFEHHIIDTHPNSRHHMHRQRRRHRSPHHLDIHRRRRDATDQMLITGRQNQSPSRPRAPHRRRRDRRLDLTKLHSLTAASPGNRYGPNTPTPSVRRRTKSPVGTYANQTHHKDRPGNDQPSDHHAQRQPRANCTTQIQLTGHAGGNLVEPAVSTSDVLFPPGCRSAPTRRRPMPFDVLVGDLDRGLGGTVRVV